LARVRIQLEDRGRGEPRLKEESDRLRQETRNGRKTWARLAGPQEADEGRCRLVAQIVLGFLNKKDSRRMMRYGRRALKSVNGRKRNRDQQRTKVI